MVANYHFQGGVWGIDEKVYSLRFMNEEKKKAVQSLKTARGQIDGIIKMVEDGRYCMDISNQIAATFALVKKSQVLILKQHIANCVTAAVEADNSEEKMDEIMKILERIIK